MGFRGDPRLSLEISYVTAKKSGRNKKTGRYVRKGEIVDWRYAVSRHNEDGTDTIIGTWAPLEFHLILTDLVKMDLRTPGRVNAEDEVTAAMDKAHADASTRIQEAHGEMADHALRLFRDRNLGRTTHYLNTPTPKHDGKGYVVRDRRASASVGE